MERFEFDNSRVLGPNTNRKNGGTRHGVIELWPWLATVLDQNFLSLAIRGPKGASRGSAALDRATAQRLGHALIKWAGNYLYCDACAEEKGWPINLPSRVYGICPLCNEGERFLNENLNL